MRINSRDVGRGDAVLFLHGWGSDLSVFNAWLDGLAPHRRVLALDLPGFGRSDEPPADWSVDEYADFVLAFLREKNVDSAVLVGHSFGGRIVIKLAARDNPPVAIPKIVLVDSAGVKPEQTPEAKARRAVFRAGRAVLSARLLARAAPGLLEAWRRRFASADYLNASPRMRGVLVRAVNEDLTPCLPKIRAPALLVWGERDRDTPLSHARIMERLIPDAGLVELKGAGHFSFLDQGYVFGRVLDSFLNIER